MPGSRLSGFAVVIVGGVTGGDVRAVAVMRGERLDIAGMGGLGRCCVDAVPAGPKPVPNAGRVMCAVLGGSVGVRSTSRKCGGMANRGPCGRALLADRRPLQRADSAHRRAGDLRIPGDWPLIDGPITWNAVVYGVLAAMACSGS